MVQPSQRIEDAGPAPARRLQEAFLEDHRRFMRGLRATLAAVREGDDERAVGLARELNAAVGAHIEFEEVCFYPELRRAYHADFVDQLYREHEEGRSAIEALLSREPGKPLPLATRKRVVAGLEKAVEHAVSCGSLLSYVDRLEDERAQALFERLLEIRAKGRRWSDRTRAD